MYKILTKFVFATIIFTGAFLFVSTDKAMAAVCDDAPRDNWGVTSGEHSKAMAGLRVLARTNVAHGNKELNEIRFNLRSSLPGISPGEIGGHDPDEQIFAYPIGEGRHSQKWFETGKPDIYRYANSSSNAQQCDGWSVLGPGCAVDVETGGCGGNTVQRGNHFVLNCGFDRTDGDGAVSHESRFWISDVTRPTGKIGEWGGRWQIKVNGTTKTNNSSNNPMNGSNNYFKVKNGYTEQITLIWHPNPKPDHNPVLTACNNLEVGGSKLTRRKVEVTNVTDGRGRWTEHPNGNTGEWTHAANFTEWVPAPVGVNVEPGAYKKKWWYKATAKKIRIKVTEYKWNGSTWVETVLRDNRPTCYDASCDLDITGNVTNRPKGVEWGSRFNVDVDVHNEADPGQATELYAAVDNRPLILAEDNGSPVNFWYNPGVPGGLGKNAHSYQSWNVEEPGGDIDDYTIRAKLYYDFNPSPGVQSEDFVLAECSASYDVYKEFDLVPSANSLKFYYEQGGDREENQEDPNIVVLAGEVDNEIPSHRQAEMDVPVTRTITKDPPSHGIPYATDTDTYHNLGDKPVEFEAGINSSSTTLGDEYCGSIRVAPAHGWQGPNDRVVFDPEESDSINDCPTIVNNPYLRYYGADVAAGSSFMNGNDCAPGNNKIRSYISARPNKSGSGAQLAAVAMDAIEGFTSASLRTANPRANHGLSFGNDSAGAGHYNGEPICSTDFFNETQQPDGSDEKQVYNSNPTLNVNGFLGGKPQVLVNGDLVLNGHTNYSKKRIIYVNGDVRITGDIGFSGFSGGDPLDAPSFMLVARGNIYIQDNVRRLDGIYVAQQHPDNLDDSGIIYTCSPSDDRGYNADEIFEHCGGPEGEGGGASKQLRVNGAFAAHYVHFHRFHKSLRDSNLNHEETVNNTNASEIFQFSPDMYLSPPPFASDAGGNTEFPFYTTLPPIL